MRLQIMPNYFLVKINQQQQKQLNEKISGSSILYQPPSSAFNARNMEYGEIVQIGSKVQLLDGFENCKAGHILIFHWSVEDATGKDNRLLFEEDGFNYYTVTPDLTRGYYNGEEIIPHPNWIFLKNVPVEHFEGEYDEELKTHLKKVNGILTFENWETTADATVQKSEAIKNKILSMSKTQNKTDELYREVNSMEKERKKINREFRRKKFLPYKVAFSNKIVDRDFGTALKEDDILYCLNSACLYLSNFQLKEYQYIICRTDQIGLLDRRKLA